MSLDADAEAKIIDAIYRGACDSVELSRAIAQIAEYFESPGVLLGELDQAQPERQFAIGARTIDQEYFARYAEHAELDPAPRAFAALAVGTASITDRMFSESFLRRNVFLNEFLVPRGVNGALACPLLSESGRFALIAVQQGVNRRSYDDDDIARVERLAPHMMRALQIRRLFLQSEARGKAFESVIDRNKTGMVGLRGDGPALFVNRAARAVAAARDGLGLDRQGRLVAADRAAATRLVALQADVAGGGAGGLVRVPRPSGRLPYIVMVSPLPSGDDLFPNSRGGVLFAIHNPARRPMATEIRIAQLLHIPRGAARVVQAILAGQDLKDYADRAGISMNTVRFHLKNAFAGTDTHSQAELVRVALSALNALEPHFADRN
ncbi:MAG TPA: LuxR C-terminal-related transcriptional regulator [Bradyrhizobium sp.]